MSDNERFEYDELVMLCRQNVGVIIRVVDEDLERVHFSPHRWPEGHTTLIWAAIWKTDVQNLSGPRWEISAGRGIDSINGATGINYEGNEYFATYSKATQRIEELAEEFEGEPFRWRDLPKRCFYSNGDEIDEPYFTGSERCDNCGSDDAKEVVGSEYDRLCRECFDREIRPNDPSTTESDRHD